MSTQPMDNNLTLFHKCQLDEKKRFDILLRKIRFPHNFNIIFHPYIKELLAFLLVGK